MADSAVVITEGTGTSIDTRTEGTNGNHRQVIIIGDPSTNAGVAPVDATAGLKVDLGADNDITGTVTANLSATDDAVLDAIEADTTIIAGAVSGTEMQVDVLTMPTVTVTATNLDVQSGGADLATSTQAGAIQTAVELIDDTVATDGSATPTKGILIAGQDGTNAQTIKTDTNGELQIDVLSIAAGNNNIGDVDVASIAAGDNNIGNVDVVTVPTDPFGANADAASATGSISAKLKGIATALGVTALDLGSGTGGTRTLRVFRDTAQFVGGTGTDTSATQRVSLATNVALPAGTNAIGKLLPPDIDVTTHTNYARKYYTNAGAVTDGIIWSPAAGKRWHVVTMYIQTSAAATITLEDDKAGGDDPVWKGELAANSGVTLSFTEKYPMASGEDAADLIITTSAGNVYVTCVGYEV